MQETSAARPPGPRSPAPGVVQFINLATGDVVAWCARY